MRFTVVSPTDSSIGYRYYRHASVHLCTVAAASRHADKRHIYRTIYLITPRRIGFGRFLLNWLSLKLNEPVITRRRAATTSVLKRRIEQKRQSVPAEGGNVKIAFDFTTSIRKLNERVE